MILSPNPKALIFDLDDTLVAEKVSAEAAFLRTCELARSRYGIEPADLHATVRETCRRFWHASPARAYCVEIGISSWEALWARFQGEDENLRILCEWAPTYRHDSWYEALARHGIDDTDLAHKLAELFPVHRRKIHVVYDDVRPALEQFERTFRLGLLTNGAPDLQREKIAGARLAEYFDEIVISGEVGFGKPNPRIYEAMLSRLAVAADEALMIGDSLHSDVRGAQTTGMKAVWLNRTGHPRDDTVVPDHEIASLTELMHLLC